MAEKESEEELTPSLKEVLGKTTIEEDPPKEAEEEPPKVAKEKQPEEASEEAS